MQKLKKIHLNYRNMPGVQAQVCHGVFGGFVSGDCLELDVFSESKKTPPSTIVTYDQDGFPLFEEPDMPGAPVQVERTIHSRLIMNRQVARDFCTWLQETLDFMDQEELKLIRQTIEPERKKRKKKR